MEMASLAKKAMEKPEVSSPPGRGSGHDAPLTRAKDDHLNRRTFAEEIFRIATKGRKEWSTRIGIYGEWGYGKTSVLNFVEEMAKGEELIFFRFNPWQFQNGKVLWREFVDGLYKKAKGATNQKVSGGIWRWIKAHVFGKKDEVAKVLDGLYKGSGEGLLAGISLLKISTELGKNDLPALQESLGSRRILVTIDDLDRTDAQLVPEILFALKELMDVPGLSFICAFDPVIVGKVLGKHHPGFDDGLRFLEKIIDYPRWLPTPNVEQLTNLALSEESLLKRVPRPELEEIIGVLSPNPRAVRQFVRLVDLLRDQVDRHYPSELYWPAILAANVMKVDFPGLAQEVLGDAAFWEKLFASTLMSEEKEQEKKWIVSRKLGTLKTQVRPFKDDREKEKLRRFLDVLVSKVNVWSMLPREKLAYQFRMAESPDAVTVKEFDGFVDSVSVGPKLIGSAKEWVKAHQEAAIVPAAEEKIVKEILDAALAVRSNLLGNAADATRAQAVSDHLDRAQKLLQIIDAFALDYAPEGIPGPFTDPNLASLVGQFRTYYHWRSTDKYQEVREAELKVLQRLFQRGFPSLDAWTDTLMGRLANEPAPNDNSGLWIRLVEELKPILYLRCSEWMIGQFEAESEFATKVLNHERRGFIYKELFLDADGPLWKTCAPKMFRCLERAEQNLTVQHNAYEMLVWLDHLALGGTSDATPPGRILAEKDIAESLWSASLAAPLNHRFVGSLRPIRERMVEFGYHPRTPQWWIDQIGRMPEMESSNARAWPIHPS